MVPAETLRHEIALLTREGHESEEVSAPRLEELCQRDPLSAEARRVRRFSRLGRLRCAVCSSALVAKFGRRRRWHFASDRRADGAGYCDHEPETEAHRALKTALHQFFEESLSSRGWSVYAERRLENTRRPDVLLVSPTGSRVAIEAQFSRISAEILGRRREAYAASAVEDLWLAGVSGPRPRASRLPEYLPAGLPSELAAVGHRVILAGVEANPASHEQTGGPARPWFAEALLVDPERGAPASWLGPNPAPPGSLARPRNGRVIVWRWVNYGPESLLFEENGPLKTPADEVFERRELLGVRAALVSRLRMLLEAKRQAERWTRPRRPREAAPKEPARRVPRDQGERRGPAKLRPRGGFLPHDERVWARSAERTLAEKEIGPEWLAFLEEAGPNDPAIRAAPARWKFVLVRVTLAHKAPGEAFLAREVARTVLSRWPCEPGRVGRERAALAVLDFLESLAEQSILDRLEGTPIRFAKKLLY